MPDPPLAPAPRIPLTTARWVDGIQLDWLQDLSLDLCELWEDYGFLLLQADDARRRCHVRVRRILEDVLKQDPAMQPRRVASTGMVADV